MIDSQAQIWKSIFPPLEKKASKHTITFPEKYTTEINIKYLGGAY